MPLAIQGSTWVLILLLFEVGMVLFVLYRKREPSAALGWSLAVILLPLLGSLLFLAFGLNQFPRRLRRKMQHREAWTTRAGTPSPDSEAAVSAGHPLATAVRIAVALGEPAPTAGNQVQLLPDGAGAFERMFEAIEAARHHIHIEMYIYRHDRLGSQLLEILMRKARAGVEVRLLLDYVGTFARWRLIRRLRRAGGKGAVFLPVWPFGKRFVPNLRNHRKIIVCDGNVAFFGGLNVGEEYLGRRGKSNWCDMHVCVRGPAVADVQRIFAEDWDFSTGECVEGPTYFPQRPAEGKEVVQILSGGPDRSINPIRQTLLWAIAHAQKRLWIASPYLVPDPAVRDALRTAALSQVDVTLLTQGLPPDNWLAYYAGAFFYPDLLEAGVRIFEYSAGMMHAKMLLSDEDGVAIGSANLDYRSLHLNFELTGVFSNGPLAAEAEQRFRALCESSTPVTLQTLRERGLLHSLAAGTCRLIAPLM